MESQRLNMANVTLFQLQMNETLLTGMKNLRDTV